MNELSLDNEARQRAFNQFMDIWITPAVMRRQETGELETPLNLLAAQILFFPDERKPEVRINSEVKLIANLKFKDGLVPEIGKQYSNEIESIDKFSLTEEDYQDCGFVVIFKIGSQYGLYFDFRYNKELAGKHVELAEQFLRAAELASDQGLLSPFIDNLFSAAELTAKAILLPHYMNLRNNKIHSRVQEYFNQFVDYGNADPNYRDIFAKLSSLRKPARYADYDMEINIPEDEREMMLRTIREMIEIARSRIATEEAE
jgi:uncharacterized protein (UPF0332 family)